MIFELAQVFHEALSVMPREHPKHRILKLLGEAIRRDIHFIDRHPTTLFQCMWNTCWWYDCPETTRHYVGLKEGRKELNAPWEKWGPKLHLLMEKWLDAKQKATPELVWLRSLRPPLLSIQDYHYRELLGHEDSILALGR